MLWQWAQWLSQQGKEIFLFSPSSRPILGFTQLPVKWDWWLLPGVKQDGLKPINFYGVKIKNGRAIHPLLKHFLFLMLF
jgi:hypothetical protein